MGSAVRTISSIGLCLLFVGCSGTTIQDTQVSDVAREWERSSDEGALSELRQLAAEGNSDAQMAVAAVDIWEGTNCDAAVAWASREGPDGHPAAFLVLGKAYEKGCGVEQNLDVAMRWYGEAARYGLEAAEERLGYGYFMGWPADQTGPDYKAARQWWERASSHGDLGADGNLAVLYYSGYGVERDLVEARRRASIGALNDNAGSQFLMAVLDSSGDDSTILNGMAWAHLAARNGSLAAVEALKKATALPDYPSVKGIIDVRVGELEAQIVKRREERLERQRRLAAAAIREAGSESSDLTDQTLEVAGTVVNTALGLAVIAGTVVLAAELGAATENSPRTGANETDAQGNVGYGVNAQGQPWSCVGSTCGSANTYVPPQKRAAWTSPSQPQQVDSPSNGVDSQGRPWSCVGSVCGSANTYIPPKRRAGWTSNGR